jgi:hypothetical protein
VHFVRDDVFGRLFAIDRAEAAEPAAAAERTNSLAGQFIFVVMPAFTAFS